MPLSEVGEERVRGYLFVLGRALGSFLPREAAAEAVREIESHLRERLEPAAATPDERGQLELVLRELGDPLQVARAYSAEISVDEALATGRPRAVGHALWALATASLGGFFGALGLFAGYAAGLGFILIALLKPIFPGNVGLFVVNGVPHSFGAMFPPPRGAEVWGGYWVIPFALFVGLGLLILMHRCSRRFLAAWRARRLRRGAAPVA